MYTREWLPTIIKPCDNHSKLPISLNCERFVLCFQKECNTTFYVVYHSAPLNALSCKQLLQQQIHMIRQYIIKHIIYIQTPRSWIAFVCHQYVLNLVPVKINLRKSLTNFERKSSNNTSILTTIGKRINPKAKASQTHMSDIRLVEWNNELQTANVIANNCVAYVERKTLY